MYSNIYYTHTRARARAHAHTYIYTHILDGYAGRIMREKKEGKKKCP